MPNLPLLTSALQGDTSDYQISSFLNSAKCNGYMHIGWLHIYVTY